MGTLQRPMMYHLGNPMSSKLSLYHVWAQRSFKASILVGGVVAVAHDGTHYAVPVAFFWCFLFLWKKLIKSAQTLIDQYTTSIQDSLIQAQNHVIEAQDFLNTVEKSALSLQETQQSIMKSAQQEAAHILMTGKKEQENIVRSYRESLAIRLHIMQRQAYQKAIEHVLNNIKESIVQSKHKGWPLVQARWQHTSGNLSSKDS